MEFRILGPLEVWDDDGEVPPKPRALLAVLLLHELTLREIGEVLGVTESGVSHPHTKAILRLKAHHLGAAAPSLLRRSGARARAARPVERATEE